MVLSCFACLHGAGVQCVYGPYEFSFFVSFFFFLIYINLVSLPWISTCRCFFSFFFFGDKTAVVFLSLTGVEVRQCLVEKLNDTVKLY